MKSAFLTVFLILPALVLSQTSGSCCTDSSTAKFAMLGSDENFRASHLEPIPYQFVAEKGKFVTFQTGDGKEARAFEVKADKETNKYVFMIHEWWGLNAYIEQEAERLQKELGDVNVLALDLYDSRIATTQEDAAKYMGEVKDERARAIIKGAFEYVGPKARVGTVGWCFGGGWSLQSALIGGKQVAACAMYYGMTENDPRKLKSLSSPVLGIFAKQDTWISSTLVKGFEEAMEKANKKLVTRWYDAVHAFANPSNPKYDKTAAADAHKHVIDFFRKNLLK